MNLNRRTTQNQGRTNRPGPRLLLWLAILASFAGRLSAQTIIVIDPGHGGKDPGNLSTTGLVHEKELNLEVALKLGAYLETLLQGVEVVYTRTTDVFISLEDRVALANRLGAHYFLSIHCDHHPAASINGFRVHIHDRRSARALAWAKAIEADLRARAGRKSMGIMDAHDRGYNLYVLKHTDMPAILMELGFMSNAAEERYLNSEQGQAYLASSLYRSFRDHTKASLAQGDPSSPTDSPPPPPEPEQRVVYRIQIAAATQPEDLRAARYTRLGLEVIEQVYAHETFRYKYQVGQEATLADAERLLRQVRDKGFPDAFIVSEKTY